MEPRDRQLLLEQKRQRLKELKQKRLLKSSEHEVNVDELRDQLQIPVSETKTVSVAIQVDNVSENNKINIPDNLEKEKETFDKGIQVRCEDDEETSSTTDSDVNEKGYEVPDRESKESEETALKEIDVPLLDALIKDCIKLLNKVVIEDAIDTNGVIDYNKALDGSNANKSEKSSISFDQIYSIAGEKGRSVTAIDVSPHFEELVIIAYSESIHECDSEGYAIVYSLKDSNSFPEYFLQCTSQINQIKFDKVNSNKIIGGLDDGTIVIWDLLSSDSSTVARLPTLSTPILSTFHTLAISSINQFLNDGSIVIVSTSYDGSVNAWSTNFLEAPKFKTIRLYSSDEFQQFPGLEDNLIILNSLLLDSETMTALASLEEKVLNTLIIGVEEGKLYRFNNDLKATTYIIQDSPNELQSSILTSMDRIGKKFIISSHLDWNLRIWDMKRSKPLINIPTTCVISSIAVRPNRPFQFITVGMSDIPVINFWDIECKVWNPIFNIPTTKGVPTSAIFTHSGNQLVIGFKDGSVSAWTIDSKSLENSIRMSENKDLDSGFQYILQSYDESLDE